MRANLVALVLLVVGSTASAQEKPAAAAPISLEVRSTGPGVYNVSVTNNGTGFGLAVFNGAPGSVTFDGKRGIGTTPTIVTVDTKAGWVRMAVAAHEPPLRITAFNDTTRKDLIAVGRSIDAVRDTLGNLTLIPTKGRM